MMRGAVARQLGAVRARNKSKKLWDKRLGASTIAFVDAAQNKDSKAQSPLGINEFAFPPLYRSIHSESSSEVLVTPPPTPLLLLEGDEMHISKDGKSRTVYRLNDFPQKNDLLLEESFDIENARKSISLIGPSSMLNNDDDYESPVADLFSFDLQEIFDGVKNGVSTGCMTWESSVVMSLYFAMKPHELRGDVIELGSGVGLGGILSTVAKSFGNGFPQDDDEVNITLTDVNEDVLDMLQQNTNAAAKSSDRIVFDENIRIQKLDWFDFVSKDSLENKEKYDTIIASDCAYLHSQIIPLAEAISKLLRGNESKMHMFAPHNRGVIDELIRELRDSKKMRVHIEDIELSKFRFKQAVKCATTMAAHRDWPCSVFRSTDFSTSTSNFIHITASLKDGSNNNDDNSYHCGSSSSGMSDID